MPADFSEHFALRRRQRCPSEYVAGVRRPRQRAAYAPPLHLTNPIPPQSARPVDPVSLGVLFFDYPGKNSQKPLAIEQGFVNNLNKNCSHLQATSPLWLFASATTFPTELSGLQSMQVQPRFRKSAHSSTSAHAAANACPAPKHSSASTSKKSQLALQHCVANSSLAE